MALGTYSELKTSIESWIHRSDLSEQLSDFIALADARINRELVTRSHEIETELTMTTGSRYVEIPAGMNYPIGLWLKAWQPRQKLTQMLPAEMPVRANISGYPEYWAIDGEQIAFDKLASAAHAFDFRYVADRLLSDDNPTNYVLTNYPDLYLWGALVEASTFTRDDQAAAIFDARFTRALNDAQSNENSAREKAPLVTEMATNNRNARFNIYRGY